MNHQLQASDRQGWLRPSVRLALITAVTALVVVAWSVTSVAATPVTIGANLSDVGPSPATTNDMCVSPTCTYVQQEGSALTASPVDGLITTWRVYAGSSGGHVRLRVLRPLGGGSFRALASSTLQTLGSGLSIFPILGGLEVKAGDVIGVDNGSGALMFNAANSSVTPVFDTAIADGAVATPNRTRGFELLLNATIVPTTAPSANLVLSVQTGAARVAVASPVTFRFMITNSGPNTAAARLVVVIPAGWTVTSAGTCTIAPVTTCPEGSLGPGESVQASLIAFPSLLTAGTTITAFVVGDIPDPNYANNAATATVTVTQPPVLVTTLRITPSAFRSTGAHAGARVTYQATGGASSGRVTFTVLRCTSTHGCSKSHKVGSIRESIHGPGANAFTFSGRVGHGPLAPGRYKLTAPSNAKALFTILA